jgi:hypothetical protein
MANKRISQLDPAASLTGTEEVPVVQSSTTVKTTAQDIASLSIQDLQDVTTTGASTTNNIIISGSSNFGRILLYGTDPINTSVPSISVNNDSAVDALKIQPTRIIYSGEESNVTTVTFEYEPGAVADITIPTHSGRLSVVGSIYGLIFPTATPSNPVTGSAYFDSASAQLKIWNGSWVSIS